MRAIGVDPSLTESGLVAVDDLDVVGWDVIKTRRDNDLTVQEDLIRRSHIIRDGIRAFEEEYGGVPCIESQQGNPRSGHASNFNLGVAYGAVLAGLETKPIPIVPSEVKRKLKGKRSVSKKEIREYCRVHFDVWPQDLEHKYVKEAVGDAAAVVAALEDELDRLAALGGHQP